MFLSCRYWRTSSILVLKACTAPFVAMKREAICPVMAAKISAPNSIARQLPTFSRSVFAVTSP
jgi:hypothetical protein